MRRAALVAVLAVATAAPIGGVAARAPGPYAERPEVLAFVREMADRHGFVESELRQIFARVRRQPAVLKAIAPALPAARSWEAYRANFLTERHLQAGLDFWQAQRAALERAEVEFGVPPQVIVAILGIETFYGRNTGRWRVVDALTTLAFDYPRRAEYFRGELAQYLLLARERGFEIFSVQGSYAGAIGIAQFMPGSYLRYAIDFDGDGAADLRASPVDAVGSIGNFLKQHGWQAGAPVLLAAQARGDLFRRYADGGVQPKHPVAELLEAGVSAPGAPAAGLAVLVELETPGRPSEWRLGMHNFYVLTRYNRSIFYAAAVIDLAAALRAAR